MGILSKLFGGKPSKEEFADTLKIELQKLFPEKEITYHGDETFCLDIQDQSTFYLSNIYQDYCKAPSSARQNVIHHYLSFFSDLEKQKHPEYFEVGYYRFFPHIRSRAFFSFNSLIFKAQGVKEPLSWPFRPFASDLVVSAVIDSEHSVGSVTAENLKDWNKSFEEVEKVAIENLFRATPGKLERLPDGIYTAPWEDIYNGSRLLLPHLFEQLNIDGDPVAIVPTRESLFVTGSKNEKALLQLPEILQTAQTKGRSLSATTLILHENRWEEFSIPESHPAYNGLSLMKTGEILSDYEEQGKLLQQIEGDDYYVASFTLIRKKQTLKVESYSVWSKDVPTILPCTDTIALAKSENEISFYRWEEVLKFCGNLMEPMGLSPERYRVPKFPDDSILEMMKPVE